LARGQASSRLNFSLIASLWLCLFLNRVYTHSINALKLFQGMSVIKKERFVYQWLIAKEIKDKKN
jgi:hypothetical protein